MHRIPETACENTVASAGPFTLKPKPTIVTKSRTMLMTDARIKKYTGVFESPRARIKLAVTL